MTSTVPGMFCPVLHSHLPWLAHHGRWPVGEEWLYQSWASVYQPLTELLTGLADEGHGGSLTLGLTPVLTAQLDDPHLLRGMHHWLGNWQLRALEALEHPGSPDGPPADRPEALRATGERELAEAGARLANFEARWRHGGSAVLRPLIDAGVLELLSGPLAHPFQPLLDPRLREFELREGLADTAHRLGRQPAGIWAPECAFAPGMEHVYAAAGVGHFLVDGPGLRGDTALGRPVGGTDVVAFGRDLEVSYRVWSPRAGYPGHAAYRDFHTFHHASGFKHARVTGRGVPSQRKAPYDPDRAALAVVRHVDDFVRTVRARLVSESDRIGRDAVVVAAFDTELFGHWWYEGPAWLAGVLRALPEAGVRVGTLTDAHAAGLVGAPVDLPACSWGAGKDWHIWDGPAVEDLAALNAEVVAEALAEIDRRLVAAVERNSRSGIVPRDRVADQILREAILCVQSDWAFLVSHRSSDDYARRRAHEHAHACREIIAASARGDEDAARGLAAGWYRADGPFGALDARRIARPTAADTAG